MIDNKYVADAIEYILEHIWDNVTLEEVAAHCNMSVSYFSKIFKKQTGQSVYAFIKKVKMEQSAIKLKMETDRSITEIGEDYGYSASNYSWAFSRYHSKSPSEFRNDVQSEQETVQEIIDRINSVIRIEEKPDYQVVYERTIGDYVNLEKQWCDFIEHNSWDIDFDTIFFERTFDDPTITEKSQCIYDICMTTKHIEQYENSCILQGGKFLVYPFKGYIKEIYPLHQELVGIWFPANHYQIDDRYSYDQYHKVEEDGYMEFDICIPIR